MTSAAASNRNPTDRNADATVHIAQLDDKVTDAVLWELMVQAAPVRHVYIPRDRITGSHFGYGFCEFRTPLDAHYATKILNMVKLFSKPIRISQSTVDRRSQDVGANLFIGNLVDEVDEKLLHDAFSAFGPIIDAPYIMRDPLTNESKRYAFVKFSSFEHSDAAIAAMDGQYICNNPITVQYAFKKDSESRERHGSQAERILAARAAEARRATGNELRLRPHTMFSDRPASAVGAQKMPPRAAVPSVSPVPSAMHPPQPPQPHVAYPGAAQAMYAYPAQQYPTAVPELPQWQTNPRVPHYGTGEPAPYQYPTAMPHQAYPGYEGQGVASTTEIGWSTNRSYANPTAGHVSGVYPTHGQQHSDPQTAYGAGNQRRDTVTPNGVSLQNGSGGAVQRISDEKVLPSPGTSS